MESAFCGLLILCGLIIIGVFTHSLKSQKNKLKRDKNKVQLLNDIKGELSTRNNSVPKVNNPMEEIEKLFQMKEKGIITEEDFKTMKEKIIKNN